MIEDTIEFCGMCFRSFKLAFYLSSIDLIISLGIFIGSVASKIGPNSALLICTILFLLSSVGSLVTISKCSTKYKLLKVHMFARFIFYNLLLFFFLLIIIIVFIIHS